MAFRQFLNFVAKRPVLLNRQSIEAAKIPIAYFGSETTLKAKPFKTVLTAMCCFGVTGGAYAYFYAMPDRKNGNLSSMIEINDMYVLAEAPIIEPSRKVSGVASKLGLKFLLYQYQTCPFCCKVRAFLDFYGIPYDVVEVNPVMRQQLKFSKYKKVPILIVQDEKTGMKHQLNDSSVIVSILGSYLLNDYEKIQEVLKFYTPVSFLNEQGQQVQEVMNRYFLMYGEKKPKQISDDFLSNERKWRKWADEEFVHVLSPNIYRSREEALQAFNYFSLVGDWEKNFATWERLMVIYVGATAMYFIGKKLKKKYSLKDDVRDSLYDSCTYWMKGIGKSKFMGGNSPNLADLSVYGFLSSIEGCDAFQDLMQHTNIGIWFKNVKDAVHQHKGYKDIQH